MGYRYRCKMGNSISWMWRIIKLQVNKRYDTIEEREEKSIFWVHSVCDYNRW